MVFCGKILDNLMFCRSQNKEGYTPALNLEKRGHDKVHLVSVLPNRNSQKLDHFIVMKLIFSSSS